MIPLHNIPLLVSYYTQLMIYTGKGYARGKTNRQTGVGTDRRPDKLDGTPKMFRVYKYRHQGKGFDRDKYDKDESRRQVERARAWEMERGQEARGSSELLSSGQS